MELDTPVDLSRHSAMFILKAREGLKLTQSALSCILTHVTELFDTRLQAASDTTVQILRQSDVDDHTVSVVEQSILSQCGPFQDMETEHLQHKYFKENFDLLVSAGLYFDERMPFGVNYCFLYL